MTCCVNCKNSCAHIMQLAFIVPLHCSYFCADIIGVVAGLGWIREAQQQRESQASWNFNQMTTQILIECRNYLFQTQNCDVTNTNMSNVLSTLQTLSLVQNDRCWLWRWQLRLPQIWVRVEFLHRKLVGERLYVASLRIRVCYKNSTYH